MSDFCRRYPVSRRRLVQGAAAMSAATAMGRFGTTRAQECSRLSVLGIVSFTEEGDAKLAEKMQEWGEANGIEVEYNALPGSDYPTQLATVVEAGSEPDIAMMSADLALFYANQQRLVDVTDVYDGLKGLGGGIYEKLLQHVQAEGKVYAIPMQSDVSVMYARIDLIEKVNGTRNPPTTLDELEQLATEISDPPQLFGIGLTLGRVADCHQEIEQLIFAHGGTVVDEQGNPAINNPGTIAALEQVKRWWDAGLIPENAPSWDDSSNNTAYQSGQVAFTFNPASIFAFLEANDPELLADTAQAQFPAGPAGSFPSVGTWALSVFNSSPCVDAAKAMITEIMQPETIQEVYEAVGGRWYPVYRDLANAPFWTERPFFSEFPTIIDNAREVWYPAASDAVLITKLANVFQKWIYPDMLQQVLINEMPPAEAAAAAQTAMEQAFAETAGP